MLNSGVKIKIIDAGYGAADCNGYTERVIRKTAKDLEGHGLPESEPHIKVLLDHGVYQKKRKNTGALTPRKMA